MKNLLKISSVFAIVCGIILVAGGSWALKFTYDNVKRENIITPADASRPNMPVRGPLTLKAQADIIRVHALKISGGKSYAEMPRQVEVLDAEGNPVLDENGNPEMQANSARETWVTATTLMTALNLGIITYVFSGLIILLGLISLWTGIVFCVLSRSSYIGMTSQGQV